MTTTKQAPFVLALLAATLLLRADSCAVEDREIAAVVGSSFTFTVQGTGNATAWADTFDLGAKLRGVLDDVESVGTLDSVRVVGARMEFTRNGGFSAIRRGNILVGNPGDEQRIIEFRAADCLPGTKGFGTFTSVNQPPDAGEIRVNWKTSGMRNVHALADSFVARHVRGDAAEWELSVQTTWSPAAPDTLPDDFDLQVRLDLQINRTAAVEVYTF